MSVRRTVEAMANAPNCHVKSAQLQATRTVMRDATPKLAEKNEKVNISTTMREMPARPN